MWPAAADAAEPHAPEPRRLPGLVEVAQSVLGDPRSHKAAVQDKKAEKAKAKTPAAKSKGTTTKAKKAKARKRERTPSKPKVGRAKRAKGSEPDAGQQDSCADDASSCEPISVFRAALPLEPDREPPKDADRIRVSVKSERGHFIYQVRCGKQALGQATSSSFGDSAAAVAEALAKALTEGYSVEAVKTAKRALLARRGGCGIK